jgi:hypothetical protein
MSEFSLDGYRGLLSMFKDAGYTFCEFEEIDARLAEGYPFVVLRHDIDMSLRPALEIARVEYEQGIQTAYFVLLCSPFYNIFSRSNAEIMQQIHQYGHQIAPHLDLAAYDNDYGKALMEVEILSKFYPYINTEIVSLHSTRDLNQIPVELSRQLDTVYGAAIRGEMAYISDSTGRWRYGHPLDSEAFRTHKPIQLLTHPIWWTQEGETATQKLDRWLYSDHLQGRATLKEFLPKLYRLNEP